MALLDQFIEYQVSQMIFKIAIPILILLGTAGNAISLIVLLKPEQRCTSVARILTVLAFTDLFTLMTAGLNNWILAVFDINIRDSSIFMCKLFSFLTVFLSQLSTLFIAAVTLNRLIAVWLPLKVKQIFTLRNTNILLFCLIGVNILASCHMPFALGLTEQGYCSQVEEINNTLIMNMCKNIQLLLLFATVAFVILANICIIGRLVYRVRYVRKQFNSTHRSAIKATSKTTRTLVLVNVVYIMCYIPGGAFFVKYRKRPMDFRTGNEADRDDAVILLFWTISVTAFLLNCAINFVLYFFSASTFRKEVKKLFK